MPVEFRVKRTPKFSFVEFAIVGGVLDPKELPTVLRKFDSLNLPMNKGLILSGRGPVWLYAALVHEAHPFAWVATFDPRLGAVVVECHVSGAPPVGAVIPAEKLPL